MGDLHVQKKIDQNSVVTIWSNKQNFDESYITRYKNSL